MEPYTHSHELAIDKVYKPPHLCIIKKFTHQKLKPMKQLKPIFAIALAFSFSIATWQSTFAQAPSTPMQPDNSADQSRISREQFPAASAYTNTNLTYKIIDAPNSTFGYDVYAEDRLMIHQTSVPGLPGNEGFKTKEDAEKVALLVIEKIRNPALLSHSGGGEMPPTISIEEMPVRR